MEWQFDRSTKRCHICNRDFQPEETYFSALLLDQPETKDQKDLSLREAGRLFSRRDYCVSCWDKKDPLRLGGDEARGNIFSFWKTRMTPERKKTPKEVLINFFDNLTQSVIPIPPGRERDLTRHPEPETVQAELRPKVIYLFALILLRKKLVRLKSQIIKDDKPLLVIERVSDNKIYEVPDLKISEAELVSLKDEFARLFEFEI